MPTKVACFLDTNILLYAALGKLDEPEKFDVSRKLLAAWDFGISTQVLGEFFVNAQRKSRRPLRAEEAVAWIEELQERPCAIIDHAIVRSAIDISQRFEISYWDAAIIAAAEQLETKVVYSEDLNHDQLYGTIRILNPFVPAKPSRE
jgi:predicted nucleic acid-binding protein